MNQHPRAPAFGRRGRRTPQGEAATDALPGYRLLPPLEESLVTQWFALDRRASRQTFFVAFAITSFALIPGMSLLAPFAVPESGAAILQRPILFGTGLVLFLVPLMLQMVQFVRRMHDQGYDTEEAILLFCVSVPCFIGPCAAGYPLATALTVIVYFAFSFKAGSPRDNRWGAPCERLTDAS